MNSTLKTKTITAVVWSSFETIGQQAIQFIIGIILARLLTPKDFGIIGMITVFMVIFQSITDSGLGIALIQKKDITNTDKSTIFYFNIATSIALALCLFVSAPLIAKFYSEPELTIVTRVLSVNLILMAIGSIQKTLLTKNIDFKSQFVVSISSKIISGIISIILAYKGFGIWSLVFFLLFQSLSSSIIYWYFSKWRPSLVFSYLSLKTFLKFGMNVLFNNILVSLFDKIYVLVIGRLFNASILGFYTQAKQIQFLPVNILSSSIVRATFPIISKHQLDKDLVKKNIIQSNRLLIFIVAPLMVYLIIVAKPLFSIVLTDKWLPSVPMFQLLCITGIVFPLSIVNTNAMVAIGRPDLLFRLNIVKYCITAFIIFVSFRFGIIYLIVGEILCSIIALYLNTYYSKLYLSVSLNLQLKKIAIMLFNSILMGFVLLLIGKIEFSNNWLLVIVQTLAGSIAYILFTKIFNNSILVELKDIVKTLVNRNA